MFKNYLKTALRNLRNNLTFTGINILGLSIALAASFIILLFVINELSFNSCHKNRKSVYRVVNYYTEFKSTWSGTPYALASTMKEEMPQVVKASNTQSIRGFSINVKEEAIRVRRALACNSEIFDIFTLPLLHGVNNGKLLDSKESICLSESLAKKIFSQTDVVGKEVVANIGNKEQIFNVTAVFKDIPKNSTFRAECFVNGWHNIPFMNKHFNTEHAETNWDLDFWTTWVKLTDGSTGEQINTQLKQVEKKYLGDKGQKSYSVQNLTDYYLGSGQIMNTNYTGDWKSIKIFMAIAILIIMVAVINYVILSTAVSSGRSKEIGVRKTFGAENKQVKYQFLMESILLSVMVLPIAILLMIITRPYAESLFDTKLPIIEGNIIYYVLVYLSLTILIGMISGLYTSIGLSRLNVMNVLKVQNLQGKKKSLLRSTLVILQLVIFCFFVACAFVIQAQYHFALKNNPGFHNKNVLLVDINDKKLYKPFLNEIKANSNVIQAGGAMRGLPTYSSALMMFPHQKNKEKKIQIEGMGVDFGFLEATGISLKEGRYFSSDFGSDLKNACILNETAVKTFGIDKPIGHNFESYNVIGVVKDFHIHSIRTELPPIMITMNEKYLRQIAIHYKEGSHEMLLASLNETWKKLSPETTLETATVEEMIRDMYESEKNKFSIVSIIAFFTMLIASFGLFGLTLFIARSRTKEIGIKKVLGCSSKSIIYSFLKTNIIYVAIASALSVPITTYAMNKWLSDYAAKTEIEWWFFAIAFLIAGLVVMATVFIHSHRAAKLNPVESLRYE